jgi:autotransporter-associated beta strand protein
MKIDKTNPLLLASLLAITGIARGADFFKADNSAALNLLASWTNNAVPGPTDTAVWGSQVSGANTTNVLGANTTWNGIQILNPGAPVQISADGNTLTNGAAGIDLSQATENLVLSNNVVLNVPQYWNVASGLTLTLGGSVVKNVGGAVRFELADSTANVVVTNPVNNLLANGDVLFGTVNDTDFAAVNGSGQIVGGNTLGGYTANPSGNFNGTVTVVDFSDAGTVGLTLNKNSVLDGLRINQPSTLNSYWTINTGTKTLSINSILVTTNVGNQTVYVNGNGPVRIYNTGTDELLLYQNNIAAPLIFQSSAPITQQGGTAVLTKLGAGTVEIQSAGAYTGGTRVYEGILEINNGGTVGTAALNIFGGEFWGATGTTNFAPATVYSNAVYGIAINSAGGQFIQASNLTLNAGSHLQFTTAGGVALSSISAPLVVTNTGTTILATNGVSIDIPENLPVGQFPLIKYAALGGNGFAAFNLGLLQPHLAAYLSNNVNNSSIDLVVLANNDPLKWAAGNGTWDIGTTADWQEQSGTTTTYHQSGTFGDSVLFEDTASGVSPITVTLNASVTPSAVTFSTTKNYIITGSGGIGGSTALTEAGAGSVTLATSNSFSGGLYLNGGVLNFSTLTNLGGGAINFSGGTLQYNANSDDISIRTVTFNSGGATINDGGGSISFANPVGNGGTGGLTKIGSGTLTLNGTNNYFGNTIVGVGTLALGVSSYINNSAAIIVSNNATLDVSANSPIVLQNQILAGNGTINGGVSVGSGGTLSPGTNGVIGTLTINNGDLTVNGGTLIADGSSSSGDLIKVNGNLNLTGGTLQLNALSPLANGTYRLIQYSGSLLSGAGSSANLALTGFSQSGQVASLTDANANEIDLVVSSAGGQNLTWQGDGGNNYWDIGVSPDWTNGSGVSVTFANADGVIFNNTSPNLTVNLKAAVQPSSVTVNASGNYVFQDGTGSGAGKVSGSTGITKSGSGTLTLLTVDNNSGATLINSGAIQVGNGGVTGDIGTGNITNNGALIFEQTDNRNVAGQVSGSGSLNQEGAATLTLAANNSYSGGTTIGSGILQIGNGGTTGTLGSSTVTNNSTLIINRSGIYSLNNAISGSGALVAAGPGTTILSGLNTYLGDTSISNGIVKLGVPNAIPSTATVPGASGILAIAGSTATLDLNGFNQTVDELSGTSGIVTNSAASGTNALTVGDANNLTFGGLILENPAGAKITLIKQGAGSLELTSANNYSGGTFVNSGTLIVGPLGTAGSATGGIILSNDTVLDLVSAGSQHPTVANNLSIPDNSAASLEADNLADTLTGTVAGGASATNQIISPLSFGGVNVEQFENFTGTVQVESSGAIRFSATAGLNNGGDNTVFDLEGGSIYVRDNGTVSLGALIGNASGSIATPSVSGFGTFVIGSKNINTAFPGIITGSNNVVKAGSGTLTLDGATNVSVTLNGDGSTSTNYSLGNIITYVGTTTISNGILALVSPVTLTNSPTITLAAPSAILDVDNDGYVSADGQSLVTNSLLEIVSGQTLAGTGTIRGNVLADTGSTIKVGLPTGLLTVTTNIEVAGAVNAALNITNSPNASELAAQHFVIDPTATLVITNAGNPLTGGEVFQLFSKPVSGFESVTLPVISSPLSWTNRLAIDGTIAVLGSIVNTNPPVLASTVTGNTLTLSWPADHTGWQLQAQTNSLSVGLSTNWVNVAGTSSTNQISLPANPANGVVFYRLTYTNP